MFTNLASYFLGVTTTNNAAATTRPETDTRLQEVEDDWLLIEKSDIQDENEALPLERTSSTSSLPNIGMEESWFVTPPPCFTSAGPITLETSPLENLLIEHPSMSVYHHSTSTHHHHVRVRSRSASPTAPPNNNNAPMPLQPNNNRRQPPNVYHHNQELIIMQLKSSQKQQQRKLHQSLKRNQLERNNKVREFSSRNKQLRRADRQNHHSGANNNRKSC